MDFQILASFIIATTVLALSPGPDNVFVLIQSARYGKKSGMAVVVGLMSGCLIHTSVVAFGLSSFIESNENLYLILKIFGCSYMLFLTFKVHKSKVDLNASKQMMPKSGLFKLFKQGFIMNVLNPKVFLQDSKNLILLFKYGLETEMLIHPDALRLVAGNLSMVNEKFRKN